MRCKDGAARFWRHEVSTLGGGEARGAAPAETHRGEEVADAPSRGAADAGRDGPTPSGRRAVERDCPGSRSRLRNRARDLGPLSARRDGGPGTHVRAVWATGPPSAGGRRG